MSASEKADILRGTLDLLVLKTLDTLGPLHGYGIAQRIQQVSGSMLSLNQGTLYPALLRLEQRGWVQSRIGTSENNRHARFYSLTASLTSPTSGSATIAGRRYVDLPNPGLEVGVLLDASAQHAGRTGREILTLAQQFMGLPGTPRRGDAGDGQPDRRPRRPVGSATTRSACGNGSGSRPP